ncbi:ATP-binding protein [Leptospira sp. 3 VSF25]|uniref:histidine kinase n=2 Tax=Leptospira limi TaxID=2950023 RepID=A0ABT3LWR0_9LEPT|nr:ATP-binding protein [Leptospira limi]
MEIDDYFISHANIAQTLALDERTIQSIRKKEPIASSLFKQMHTRYGMYENIFIFGKNENLKVIADALSGKTLGYGSDPEQKEDLQRYYASALFEKVAIAKAKRSPITGDTVVVLSTLIRDQGKVIGTLCIALSLNRITDKLISRIQMGKEGYVFVAEEDGPILAHKMKELILDFDISKAEFGKEIMEMKSEEIGNITFKGEPRYLMVQRLKQWKMMVVAIQPLKEIHNSLKSLLSGIVCIAIIVISLSIFLVYRIANQKLSPLGKIETTYRDEIRLMSDDLNKFIHSVSKSIEKVEIISEEVSDSATELSKTAESLFNFQNKENSKVKALFDGESDLDHKLKYFNEDMRKFYNKINNLTGSVKAIEREIQIAVTRSNYISLEVIKGENQLKQTQKLETLGQIAGGVAHDFNNILAIISGNLELIQRRNPNPDPLFIKKIESAMGAVERGSQLTQKLLSFARKQIVSPNEVEINQVISNMEEMLKPVIGKHIDLKIQLYKIPLRVFLDPFDLETSILNLVINARDAMENTGVIEIRINKVKKNSLSDLTNVTQLAEHYVEISVTDTGRGMSREIMDRIYEPFFTTKPVGQGTGLGLSMLFTFVNQFNGFVKVNSEINVGSCFRVYFPLLENIASFREEIELSAKRENPTKYKGKVLLVDDEIEILEIAKDLLSDMGFTVQCVTSGDEAKILLELNNYDILISDVMMPGKIDGLKLAEIAQTKHKDLKIILTSGFPGDLRKREYIDLDKYHFMNKPYRAAQLENTIKEVLESSNEHS